MPLLTKSLLLAFAIVMGWFVWRSQFDFIIRINNGEPKLVKGKVTAAFLEEVAEICSREALATGSIKGVRRGERMHLVFSRTIPTSCRQRIRNVWQLCR